jgi:hypothetical protein
VCVHYRIHTSRPLITPLASSTYQNHHHHHKHPGLGHLARSVSRVTVALSIVSSLSQLSSFLVGCSGMILEGFGFVAFFAGVKASSFCIQNSSIQKLSKYERQISRCRIFKISNVAVPIFKTRLAVCVSIWPLQLSPNTGYPDAKFRRVISIIFSVDLIYPWHQM